MITASVGCPLCGSYNHAAPDCDNRDPSVVVVVDWWCEQDQAWVMCPGPCPDGTPHEPMRYRRLR